MTAAAYETVFRCMPGRSGLFLRERLGELPHNSSNFRHSPNLIRWRTIIRLQLSEHLKIAQKKYRRSVSAVGATVWHHRTPK